MMGFSCRKITFLIFRAFAASPGAAAELRRRKISPSDPSSVSVQPAFLGSLDCPRVGQGLEQAGTGEGDRGGTGWASGPLPTPDYPGIPWPRCSLHCASSSWRIRAWMPVWPFSKEAKFKKNKKNQCLLSERCQGSLE